MKSFYIILAIVWAIIATLMNMFIPVLFVVSYIPSALLISKAEKL